MHALRFLPALRWALAATLLLSLAAPAAAQGGFVNWESPHVHPLDLTPDGARLLAVNTPDGRLEVFALESGRPVLARSIPVGVDPVSVRARTAGEAWVVNQISDSVSIVDLSTGTVVRTLWTGDEPADVVFAGAPARALFAGAPARAFVSCSQVNTIQVFDLADLDAAPQEIVLEAEEPRALAVSAAGDEVYVAVFESGNGTTLLAGGTVLPRVFPPQVVNDPAGPWGGVNPPPNAGAAFDPPVAAGLPAPPRVGLIVRQDAGGRWMDDNGGDWTALVSGAQARLSGRPVGWQLLDHDLAVIDAATLAVTWRERLMNVGMALAVHPATGQVTVVGTDATNEVRFEPNLSGRFLRVELAFVAPAGVAPPTVLDLNGHLSYATSTLPQASRDQSLGDPRGIAWNAAGSRAWITGMGSNNVVVVDATGARAGLAATIEVGQGPTGVVLDERRGQAYVLDKFESAVSVVSIATELETARIPFFDPSPAAVKAGRKHLYDTHATSGLGHTSCGACHVDARFDRLAWDLGDPSGAMKSVAGQNLGANVPGLNTGFEDFHPMKGPMTTQTLQDIIGKEPHHWRGDRDGLEEFNGAFEGLLGDDAQLSAAEMQEFEDFLATIHFPPNPFRNLDNSLPARLPLPGHYTTGRFGPAEEPLPDGNAQHGLALFRPPNFLDGGIACVSCHTLPTGLGTDRRFQFGQYRAIAPGPNGEHHHALVSTDEQTNVSMKIPHLRNQYDKVGFRLGQPTSRAGFGFAHDGSVDSIERFIAEPLFDVASDQDLADLVAFMLAFTGSDLPRGSPTALFEPPGTASLDTHAAVGQQVTLRSARPSPDELARLELFLDLADGGAVGLVAKARRVGVLRGFAYQGGGSFQSDRRVEVAGVDLLVATIAPGGETTFTVVPAAAATRVGIDRDGDGAFDRDELDAGSDPADAGSVPACGLVAPAAPLGLAVTATDASSVALAWTDASANESGFTVERRRPNGPFTTVAVIASDRQAFVDTTVGCSEALVYRVRAFNCGGLADSGEVLALTDVCELELPRAPRRGAL